MRLHDFLDFHVREHPESPFATMGDRTVTYGEASQQINRLANAFSSAGLKKGDRVAVLSKNSVEYAFIYFAGAKSGVVPVPLNYRLAPHEWTYILNDSQAKMQDGNAPARRRPVKAATRSGNNRRLGRSRRPRRLIHTPPEGGSAGDGPEIG